VITPSRFGYLGSEFPEDATVAAQADAYVALMDALEIPEVPVLAFSAGSSSAVQLALRHPDRVAALVLVAANSPHEKAVSLVPRALAPLLFSQPSMWLLRMFAPKQLASISGVPTGYELDPNDQRTLETIFDSFFPIGPRSEGSIFDGYVGNPDIANYPLEKISVPTLGVHAADDPLASYEDARAMVARIPGSTWVEVEKGGHIFIHKDEAAVAEIARFISRATAPEVRSH
jgi:pimeloyl-ACP methyl ester carboxylesterase